MDSTTGLKTEQSIRILRWVYLYQCLTEKQKDEVARSIPVMKIPDYETNPCFILAEDKEEYIRYYNIAIALSDRILRKHIHFVWSNRGTTIKFKVLVTEKQIVDNDELANNMRLTALRSLPQYSKSRYGYEKSLTIRKGKVNRCLSEAIRCRTAIYEELGMPLPDCNPTLFASPDLSHTAKIDSKDDFQKAMLSIFGRYADIVLWTEFYGKQNNEKGDLLMPIRVPIDFLNSLNGSAASKRAKSARWNLYKISKAIHKTTEPSEVNRKFHNDFQDLEIIDRDVVIVGAGVSGLAAANYLSSCGADLVVVEGRSRIGGRACTTKFPPRKVNDVWLPEVNIDLGANYLHCCSSVGSTTTTTTTGSKEYLRDPRLRRSDFRSLIGICKKLAPVVADVAGGANWESTVYTRWGDMSGKRIEMASVVRANMIAEKIRARAARKVNHLKKYMRNLPGNPNTTNQDRDVWYVREGVYREIFGVPKENETTSHPEIHDYSLSSFDTTRRRFRGQSVRDENYVYEYNKSIYTRNGTYETSHKHKLRKTLGLNSYLSQTAEGEGKYLVKGEPSNTVQDQEPSKEVTNGKVKLERTNRKGSTKDSSRYLLNGVKKTTVQKNTKFQQYKLMEIKLKNSPLGIPHHINFKQKLDSKSFMFDTEGNRKSLWDIYVESITEIFAENNLCITNVSEAEWSMIFVILQSRIGYNSDLRETCISMCRLPNVDVEYDNSTVCLSEENYMENLKFIFKHYKEQTRIETREFNFDNDSDKLMIDGWDWLLNTLTNGLENRVYLNSTVTDVEVNVGDMEYPVAVRVQPSNDKSRSTKIIRAKYAIVAVPSSLLSPFPDAREHSNQILFKPPLDRLKCEALTRYKMGHHNKVILRFHPDDVFWTSDTPQINSVDPRFQFINLDMYGKSGCILAHCFPPYSSTFANIDSDVEIVRQCLESLTNTFGIDMHDMPYPVDALVTKWYKDSFSMGSYSYPGVNASDDDIIHLKSPHPLEFPRVLFSGEYLSSSYYQCVDGAYDTGMRAAEDVAHLGLGKPYPFPLTWETPSLDGMLSPTAREKYLGLPIPIPGNEILGFYLTDGSDEAFSQEEIEDPKDWKPLPPRVELPILTHVQTLVAMETVNVASYDQELDSVISSMGSLKLKNQWNRHLESAYSIAKAVLDVVRNSKDICKTEELDMGSKLVAQRILKSFLSNEGSRHEYVCHACLSGGELLMCDSPTCNKVWHVECLPQECSTADSDTSASWACPLCQNIYKENADVNTPTAVSLYWKRRTDWWSVKSLVTHCRKVAERIKVLARKVSKQQLTN